MKKTTLKILILFLVLSAILSIVAILFGIVGNILATSLIIFIFSILSLCCYGVHEKYKGYSSFCTSICIACCIYLLFLIWTNDYLYSDNYILEEIAAILSIISVSLAHTSLLLLNNSNHPNVKTIKIGTIILSVLLDFILIYSVFTSAYIYSFEIYIVLLILVGLGTILVPTLSKLYKIENVVRKEKEEIELPELKEDISKSK